MDGNEMVQFLAMLFFCLLGEGAVFPNKIGGIYLPECTHLQDDGTQANALIFPSGKKCCMCPKGTFLEKLCENEVNSTICSPCPPGTYMDYEPHDRKTCQNDIECMGEKIAVGGSATQVSRCVCPPGKIEEERHCIDEKLSTLFAASSTSSAATSKSGTLEDLTPATLMFPNAPTTEQTKTAKLELQSLSMTGTQHVLSSLFTDFEHPASTMASTSSDGGLKTGKQSDINYGVIALVIVALLFVIGLIWCIVREKRPQKRQVSNYHRGTVQNSTESSVSPLLSQAAADEGSEVHGDQALESNPTLVSMSSNETIQSVTRDDQDSFSEQTSVAILENDNREIGQDSPVIFHTRKDPEVAENDNCNEQNPSSDNIPEPVILFTPELSMESVLIKSEVLDALDYITTTDDQISSLIGTIEEQPNLKDKAEPFDDRESSLDGTIVEQPNNKNKAEPFYDHPRMPENERDEVHHAMREMAQVISRRDLPSIARSLLSDDVFIQDMLTSHPSNTPEAAYQIFRRAQQVDPNLSLASLLSKVQHLGYLADIVRRRM